MSKQLSVSRCEIVEVSGLSDATGDRCTRVADGQCSDCGTLICELHTENCDINTAQVTYQSQFPNLGYASALSQLGPTASTGCTTPTSAASCLLDYVLSNATAATKPKSGYYFTVPATVTGGGINVDFTVNGLPAAAGQTGVRGFCSNSDGVIRYNNPAAAAASNSACAGLTALQ